MVKCNYCNAENYNKAIYCQKCGRELGVDWIQCSNCYTKNPNYVKYCQKCGRELIQWDIKTDKRSEPYKIGSIMSFITVGIVLFLLIFFWMFWF